MYIAIKYIGKKYTPGEILPDDLTADEVKWLLEAGAIRKAAPATAEAVKPDGYNEKPQDADDPKPIATPDDEQEAETAEEEPQGDKAEDEIDEEAEAPEIDVMDGLVAAAAEEKKPTRMAAHKSAGKAAKGGKTK